MRRRHQCSNAFGVNSIEYLSHTSKVQEMTPPTACIKVVCEFEERQTTKHLRRF